MSQEVFATKVRFDPTNPHALTNLLGSSLSHTGKLFQRRMLLGMISGEVPNSERERWGALYAVTRPVPEAEERIGVLLAASGKTAGGFYQGWVLTTDLAFLPPRRPPRRPSFLYPENSAIRLACPSQDFEEFTFRRAPWWSLARRQIEELAARRNRTCNLNYLPQNAESLARSFGYAKDVPLTSLRARFDIKPSSLLLR